MCGVITGAKAMPNRFNDIPKMATLIETSNSSITPVMPAVYDVMPKALHENVRTSIRCMLIPEEVLTPQSRMRTRRLKHRPFDVEAN